MVELFANSEDPDQTPHSAASDLGLHSLPVTLFGVSRLQWINEKARYYYYTPDIRSMCGVDSFRFSIRLFIRLFVCTHVRSFVRSFVRSSFRHRVKVFALKFIRPHILKTL